MDKDLFRRTEERVERYFKKDAKIKSLKKSINLLEKQIKNIEEELRSCNISIEPESSSPGFEERVQTSSNGMSYAEREVMRVTELKIRRRTEKRLKIEELQELIENIETDSIDMEEIMLDISNEHKEILRLKYEKGWNEYKIAEEVHLSQSQVNKKIRQVIIKIGDWSRWGGIILE